MRGDDYMHTLTATLASQSVSVWACLVSQMRMVLSTEQEANTVPSVGLHWMSSTESSCPCAQPTP